MPLSQLLQQEGLTYDSLRYVHDSVPDKECMKPAESIEDIEPSLDNIPAISFFSGAGGLDIGFKYAGFNNIISVEINEIFCGTLRKNNPSQTVIGPPDSG